jgi:hypothetical protein
MAYKTERIKKSGWWETMSSCWAITKKGERCQNVCRDAYEISRGDLFIPFTCEKHKDKENEIRKEIKLREAKENGKKKR